MSLPFLLEIGTEEIPDWMIPGALEDLGHEFRAQIQGEPKLDATPRRLVLRSRLLEREVASSELVIGPSTSAPSAAVSGFARKHGLAPEQLQKHSSQKGEYWSFLKPTGGRLNKDILAERLPSLIIETYFPKTMYWRGKSGPRFIRPIRWIVALLGEEVVPFEIAGVRSGNTTSGHRRLGAPSVVVTTANYEQKLRDNYVILSADERRKMIQSGLAGAKPDPALLETLVYLTEYPAPLTGSFDPQYLELPQEVLITVMRHHQKYFSVEDANGKLAPRFIAVMNIPSDPEGFVRRGNERVLRARFNDARFFWDSDQKKRLDERLPDLAHVTFQAQLGSYREKTMRVMQLVEELGGKRYSIRAAQLCKCDLTTELVKEFPELQGVVGGLYARAQGERREVWQAIYDHYKPQSMEDALPRNLAGQYVSLADKVDTLRGCFRVGLIPTGSRDPFALRRAAQAVVRLLTEGRIGVPLLTLLEGNLELIKFFEDRVKYYFRDVRGFAYDEVNAAMAAGWSNLVDSEARLLRIQRLRPTPDFEPLAASFKRIRNILEQAKFEGGRFDESLLEPGPEAELYRAYKEIAGQPIESAISRLRPKVDLFFDKVLVNAPDARIRENRLTLLHTLLREFSTIADFSEIVTGRDKNA